MRYEDFESKIVYKVAQLACEKVARKTIAACQKLKYTLSGEGSLTNTWDEICVQLQQQYSIFLVAYEDVI